MKITITPENGSSGAIAYSGPNKNATSPFTVKANEVLEANSVPGKNNEAWYRLTASLVYIYGKDATSDIAKSMVPQPFDPSSPSGGPRLTDKEIAIIKKTQEINIAFYAEENLEKNYSKSIQYLQTQAAIAKDKLVSKRMDIKKFKYIYGAPFQFIDNTDPRRQKDQYGRSYTDRIISNAPIAVFTPGSPAFNSSWKIGDASKDKLLTIYKNIEEDSKAETDMKAALSEMGLYKEGAQYYYFKPQTALYYKYVNTLCRTSAHFAGIGDKSIYINEGKSVKAKHYNFRNTATDPDNSSTMRNLIGFDEAIAYYFEPGSGISESFGNTTSESALSGLNKGVSDKAREAEQMLGAGAGIALDSMADANVDQVILNMNDIKAYDKNSPLSRIKENTKLSFLGANLRLPELWRDSQYIKNYSIDMKFVSPYGTKLSKWLHVLVPFFSVVCLAAPMGITGNSYKSPFLVKAYSKGYFNCEMAIIDSVTIKKFGDGDGVTEDGMPSEIEVSISFKDLYTAMTLTSLDVVPLQFLSNSGLIEFIGTTTGLNMNRAGTEAYLWFMYDTAANAVTDFPGNFWYKYRDHLVKDVLLDSPILGDLMKLGKINK